MKEVSNWDQIKDKVYGNKGTPRRDKLDKDTNKFLDKINKK